MKVQFNLFGFEIQVSRPQRYGVCCWYRLGEVELGWCYDFTTTTLLSAWLRGWRQARTMAFVSGDDTMFLIYRISDIPSYPNRDPLHVRVISVRKQVSFFSK